jgi:hypothetical protein
MTQNLNSDYETSRQAEETLRLVSRLSPPADLTGRVHRRLANERETPARRGFWSLWLPAQRVQFAAAAALVIAVAGSTWSVYHGHPRTGGAPVTPSAPRVLPGNSGGFGSAGAERVPPTLHPIRVPSGVPPAPKKKPGASRVLAKPSPKTLAAQPSAAEGAVKPQANQ